MAIELDLLHPVTDEELLRLSERNPGYQFERTADGRLVVSPTGSKSDWRSVEIWTYPALVDRVTLTDSGFADHLLSNSSGDRYPRAECRRLRL
jgi:hypothetical protein